MKTTVILPCWVIDNTLLQFTMRCIESIRETSDAHIIIVDNGSTLGKDYMWENADTYVRNHENLGYVRAINQGMSLARTPYIVAGNNDYEMKPGWEKVLQDCLDNPKCGTISFRNQECMEKGQLFTEGTPGGWWMIKYETVQKLGLLDEQFFNTFADFDYCWRMKMSFGLETYSTTDLIVNHYKEASLSKDSNRKAEWEKGMELILGKWGSDEKAMNFLSRRWM